MDERNASAASASAALLGVDHELVERAAEIGGDSSVANSRTDVTEVAVRVSLERQQRVEDDVAEPRLNELILSRST